MSSAEGMACVDDLDGARLAVLPVARAPGVGRTCVESAGYPIGWAVSFLKYPFASPWGGVPYAREAFVLM